MLITKRAKRRIHSISAFILSTGILLSAAGCAGPGLLDGPRPQGETTPAPVGEEWMDLLAQVNQGGWSDIQGHEDACSIEEDVLVIHGRHPVTYVAFMPQSFGDFQLHLKFRLSTGANSGLFLRADPQDPVQRGFEVQLIDDHGRRPSMHGTGALYDVATPMFNMARPAGQWNSLDVTFAGQHLDVAVNGWKVIDVDIAGMSAPIGKFATPLAELPREGHIMLQDHGHEVFFRDISVKPLDTE